MTTSIRNGNLTSTKPTTVSTMEIRYVHKQLDITFNPNNESLCRRRHQMRRDNAERKLQFSEQHNGPIGTLEHSLKMSHVGVRYI